MISLKDFGYTIPESLIAQHPLHRRDQARLMVINRQEQTIQHDIFSHIDKYLPPNSCLVVNDSKVVPARLFGRREGHTGRVEVFLLKKLDDGYSYETLMRPLRKLKNGERIVFDGSALKACVVDRDKRIVRFNKKDISKDLNAVGHIPLPPYIKRQDRAEDRKYYQTVFAQKQGSVAAPTAGLHFTQPLLNRLKKQGHKIEKVTLHVNYGTFKPVEEEDITQHPMHWEDYVVTKKTFQSITQAKTKGQKIVAVGTTSCRVLESMAKSGNLKASTNLFVYPGYTFQLTDMLLTNFHLPYSTLLMLVSALGTQALIKKAYAEAIQKKYRFYSYGDAMLII